MGDTSGSRPTWLATRRAAALAFPSSGYTTLHKGVADLCPVVTGRTIADLARNLFTVAIMPCSRSWSNEKLGGWRTTRPLIVATFLAPNMMPVYQWVVDIWALVSSPKAVNVVA